MKMFMNKKKFCKQMTGIQKKSFKKLRDKIKINQYFKCKMET